MSLNYSSWTVGPGAISPFFSIGLVFRLNISMAKSGSKGTHEGYPTWKTVEVFSGAVFADSSLLIET